MDRRSKSEQPLGEFSSCLSLWKISSIKLDIGRFSRTMFQELCLIAVIGIVAFLLDSAHTKYLRLNSTWEMFIPLIFMLALIGVKYFEDGIFQRISRFAKSNYEESDATLKIVQKMIVLGYLVFVNTMTYVADTPGSRKRRWFGKSCPIQIWLDIGTKLRGVFPAIIFFRLYLDIMFLACRLIYNPKTAMMSRKLDKRILPFDENTNILEEQYISYNRYHSGENVAARRSHR